MQRRVMLVLGMFILVSIMAAGCSGGGADAASVTKAYMQALVDKNENTISDLSCADWEAQAKLEVESLQSVKAELKDVSCKVSGTDVDKTLVSCQGSIQFTYTNESQQLDLSQRTYEMVKEGGEWRVCGYH
ncbi:MAG: hypothetical protein ABSA51_00630 [Anaerolineaceae bacterium]